MWAPLAKHALGISWGDGCLALSQLLKCNRLLNWSQNMMKPISMKQRWWRGQPWSGVRWRGWPIWPRILCNKYKCETLAKAFNVMPEGLPSKARCVSCWAGFPFSRADGAEALVYICVGAMGGASFQTPVQVPGCQSQGVWDHLVEGLTL